MGDVAVQEQGQQSLIPAPASKDALVGGNKPAALNPRNLPEAMQLAEMLAMSGMTPKAYGNEPAKILVGIMAGAEVGLAPFQALQSIAVIGNNPAIWGDGALALVQASGLLVDMHEEDDGDVATCTLIRRNRQTAIVRSFSVDDAKKAGLAGKAGPWTQYPKRMRQMRARLFAIRDGFADVLKGLAIAEEVQDIDEPEARTAAPRVTIGGLRQQAGRAEPVDETLADDAQLLQGKAVEDATSDGAVQGVSEETAEQLREGRSDEQHGDQHDGTDDVGAGQGDELSPAERQTMKLIEACERASEKKHLDYVQGQFDKHAPGLEPDQCKRVDAAFKAAKSRLKL